MFRYICKRMVYLLITLLIILTTTFFLMKKLPGTPFDSERFSLLPADQQAQLLEKYGLNDPVIVQYGKYILNVAKGDFGTSFFYSGQPVSGVIMGRIGPSALIGIQAILIGLSIGLILGIIAAWRHNSGIDYFTMVIAVLGVSVPNFVAAALLQYYVGLKWGLLPVAFWESWKNSVLPSIALSFSVTAMIARFMRTEMLDVLGQDYIVTAKAKGLNQFKVLMRHAVRNSIIPVVTILGPIVVNLLTGSLAVENIYSIPGIGSLFVDSIKTNDYSTIMGITVFYSAFYIFVMLVVDILYSVIDPRIRLASNGKGD
ncbi:ABC transporter permease [Caproiciproducens galactitolivorans]|uniref:Oligopeptide transport system permease protein OppB n=1 Tax=Caproiciproducens galactitolivorans TaxID=642589 RepID=A0A4Z0YCD8_9FIRM|nr:ABC transporter permease [Caproiciproducens galactitolivorans]QEY35229.1 ABC transporter permease [Caproiciproducens galactitolivorans]TGJ76921.1 oligopeptide transport system permease protein OppB [Caproiciproducens galactitolivorans]